MAGKWRTHSWTGQIAQMVGRGCRSRRELYGGWTLAPFRAGLTGLARLLAVSGSITGIANINEIIIRLLHRYVGCMSSIDINLSVSENRDSSNGEVHRGFSCRSYSHWNPNTGKEP